jgi:DNA modification methylase
MTSTPVIQISKTINRPVDLIDLDDSFLERLGDLSNIQKAIPRIAKDPKIMQMIKEVNSCLPSEHHLYLGDARKMLHISPESVHLILTSPPYWNLKSYNSMEGQMGDIDDYNQFIHELNLVWEQCYQLLVPGGRLICIVGDVCLSRRKNNGRHSVFPLHASIQESCRNIGFDNLSPIIWHKISNAVLESKGNGTVFMGKPYEPNGIIKNDIEFILMQRKPGGYRKANLATKILSIIPERDHRAWFQQIWSDIPGAYTRNHPAPYPLELATRLIKMFSFVGDVVLDPFSGTGTTSLAAANCGRNSIGYEIDPTYLQQSYNRLTQELNSLFNAATVIIHI